MHVSPLFAKPARRGLGLGVMLVAMLMLGSARSHASTDPGRLWSLLQQCAAAQHAGQQPPLPCARVSGPASAHGSYAVLKDRQGKAQYLLLPMTRTHGIEESSLLAADAPNYLADAWALHDLVQTAAGGPLPLGSFGLVVNSAYGRSQNQLHIHADCMAPEVMSQLSALHPGADRRWHRTRLQLGEQTQAYQWRWISGAELTLNPFRVLAGHLPAGEPMAEHSLVLVGARDAHDRPGFVLLSGRRDVARNDNGNADRLQDLACTIATHSPSIQ